MIRIFRRFVHFYKYDLSFFLKLLFSYVVIIILPMLAFSLSINSQISRVLESQLEYSASQNFKQTEMSLNNTIRNYDTLLLSISKSELFSTIEKKQGAAYTVNEQVNDRNALEKMIYSFIGLNQCSVKVYFDNKFTSFTNGQNFFNYRQVKDQEWYRTFTKLFQEQGETVFLCPPSSLPENSEKSQNAKILSIARVISDPENYRDYIGLLRLNFSKSTIDDILEQNDVFRGSLTCMVSEEGALLSSNQNYAADPVELSSLTNDASLYDGDAWGRIRINGKDCFAKITKVGGYRLNLVTIIPEEGILEECSHIHHMIFALLLILCSLAFLIALLVSSSFNRRLALLAGTMNQVQNGKLLPLHARHGRDEIGRLADSYNYMIEQMHEMIKETYRNGQKLKAYELDVLQAQINPHFLYNTLDMINWFAGENMNDKIRKAVQSIATYYKLSLSSGKTKIPIKDEISHVSAYMQLQNMRYMDRLHFVVRVPEEIQDYVILKTTLQPIVENSISHGIMEKEDKEGTIEIRAEISDGDIVIAVTDDGVGMTPQRIAEIEAGTIVRKTGSGFGLSNVNTRLKIYYGRQYGLGYRSSPGAGTTVIVKIAAEKDKESLPNNPEE
ncbi:MAG: sensor histidine kinase [Clostridiales bacterium]|nr:sensor histidine kinase [Clostridiales bacterium]